MSKNGVIVKLEFQRLHGKLCKTYRDLLVALIQFTVEQDHIVMLQMEIDGL